MSVIRSKRMDTNTEYENTFTELYRFSETQTAKIANRRKRWICEEYNELMNRAFNNIMTITESSYHKPSDNSLINSKIIDTLTTTTLLMRMAFAPDSQKYSNYV